MKKSNKKPLILAIVALILVLVSFVSFTYSWIDDIKLVEFTNDNLADNGAPLKTGTDINATVNITKGENDIDLGNMLKTGDISFQYKNGTPQQYSEEDATAATAATQHIKYDTDPTNPIKNPKWEDVDNQKGINKKKGYFYESGGMHLSACYGDGESFYFQRQGGQSGYREANKDDENVNYISFTVKVSSPDATTDFWFDSVPTIQGKNASGSNIDVSAKARYAIIVDGECHVYSNGGTALTCNSALNGTEAVSGVRNTAAYTYYNTNNDANNTAERGYNSNTLFSIKKGGTVNMTVKIWLEGSVNSNVTTSNINLKLISSWAKTRKIWIEDKTTGGLGESWLNNNSPKLYITFPEFLKSAQSVSDWANASNGFYPITVDNGTHKGYVNVPLVYNNEKMVFYRCNNIYWNNYTTNNNSEDPPARSEYNVHCWNWWQTNTPNTYCDETYTLYGGSKDSTAKGYFGYQDSWITNKGYGTWGEVEQISVYSHYDETDYATSGQYRALYIVDYSDEDASSEVYIYEMSRADNGTSTPWKVYVPKSSSKIEFRYFSSGNNTAAWGYNSWGGENPQRRPLQSTGLYSSNSTVYHFCRYFGGDKGWGYWNGADNVYLIKKGFLGYENNLYAYMFDSKDVYLKTNSTWRADNAQMSVYCWTGSTNTGWLSMTKKSSDTYYAAIPEGSWSNIIFARRNPNDWNTIWTQTSDLTYHDGQEYDVGNNSWSVVQKGAFPGDNLTALTYVTGSQEGSNVYKQYSGYQSQVFKSGSALVYNSVIFSKGDNSNQGKTLTLFPGCFYEPGDNKTDNGKWLGALNENGRDASTSGGNSGGGGGGGSGTDAGGDSTDGYTGGSDGFKITLNGNTYDAVSKQTSNGTEYKVRIGGLSAGTHEIKVYKNSNQYKNGDSQGYKIFPTNSNMSLYITTGAADHNQEIGIQNFTSGNFIVTFHYDNWDSNRDTIMISSILKEGSS